jgi:peptide deformylase
MAKLTILEYPDPRLRTKAALVERLDAELGRVIDDMFETMYAAPGIGLAATSQCPSPRLVVDVTRIGRLLVFVNPRSSSAGKTEAEEGCCPCPVSRQADPRAARIVVRARPRRQAVEMDADGCSRSAYNTRSII